MAQAVAKQPDRLAAGEDEYLGFRIHEARGVFVATPHGWHGDELVAASLPILRHEIWSWWHELERPAGADGPRPQPVEAAQASSGSAAKASG
jgi:hypothetical protein